MEENHSIQADFPNPFLNLFSFFYEKRFLRKRARESRPIKLSYAMDILLN